MRSRTRAAVVAVLLTAACGELVDPAAAVVHGNEIAVSEVAEAVEEFASTEEFETLAQQRGGAARVKRLFEQSYLSALIRRAVLQPLARDYGVTVTEQDVAQRIEQIRQDFPNQRAFQQALAQQGLTLEQLQRLVEDRILEERLRERVLADTGPSEAELRDYYRSHRDEFVQTRARHILVDDRSLAQEIAAQLQQTPPELLEQSFEELAARHSKDPSNAQRGGELGFFSPGEFVPEFEQAAEQLRIGQVSDPVRTEFGFHVILVTDRRVRRFEQVRDEIAEQLGASAQEDAWQQWLRDVYEQADVAVNPRYGHFDVETQQIVEATAGIVPGTELPRPQTSPATP